jgi:hypothetical protein
MSAAQNSSETASVLNCLLRSKDLLGGSSQVVSLIPLFDSSPWHTTTAMRRHRILYHRYYDYSRLVLSMYLSLVVKSEGIVPVPDHPIAGAHLNGGLRSI